MNTENTILDLDSLDARDFFLKNDSYCNFELPLYFDFAPLLEKLARLDDIPKDITHDKNGNIKTHSNIFKKYEQDEVNFVFYVNKNGQFAWRPFQLINPVAYVYLVNIITNPKSWKKIKNRFSRFQKNKNILCCSIPVVKNSAPSTSGNIRNWHEWFEKESIKKSLDFNYMVSTDITDCYGSIYTHSIAWALHWGGKYGAKKDRKKAKIYNAIDVILQDIQYGQTAGIPQGSVLMDFVAEMVLGYADLKLSNKLRGDRELAADKYYILRYRDDYRIFAKTKIDAEKITKYLTEVLAELNLKLNENKTSISENIVTDAQKCDKIYYRNIELKKDNLNTRILQIHSLAEKYPNSGSVVKAMTKFYEDFCANALNSDLELIASVAVDIAYHNPRTYAYVIAILGKISSLLADSEVENLFERVTGKFKSVPNNEYFNIWLQRLAKNKAVKQFCGGDLCNYVKQYCLDNKSPDVHKIWKFKNYGNKQIQTILKQTPIVNIKKFKNMEPYPEVEELSIFSRY